MALLLDTAPLPRRERAEAAREALGSAISTASISVDPGAVNSISAWMLRPGADLVSHTSTGYRITRTARHCRADAPERVSLGIPLSGSTLLRHRDLSTGDALGEIHLVDLTSPYDFLVSGPAVAQAYQVDVAQLGLPVDLVRRAVPRLRTSPVYRLTQGHLLQLPHVVDALPAGAGTAMLASATTELVRALIATAADSEGRQAVDALEASLFTRVTTFIQHHQREADLSAERLAAAHNVSVRTLYAEFAKRDQQPSSVVMRGRLEGARHDLARPGAGRPSVAGVARAWGFVDPRHFARRFRAAYGMSPQEWQHLAAVGVRKPGVPGPRAPSEGTESSRLKGRTDTVRTPVCTGPPHPRPEQALRTGRCDERTTTTSPSVAVTDQGDLPP